MKPVALLRAFCARFARRKTYRQAPPMRNPRYLGVHIAATSKR